MTYFLVSHHIAAVAELCDRLGVMQESALLRELALGKRHAVGGGGSRLIPDRAGR